MFVGLAVQWTSTFGSTVNTQPSSLIPKEKATVAEVLVALAVSSAFGQFSKPPSHRDPSAPALTPKIGPQAVPFFLSECFKIVRMFNKIC